VPKKHVPEVSALDRGIPDADVFGVLAEASHEEFTVESHVVAGLAQEQMLWDGWRNRKDVACRERLIAHYLPYARVVAATYYRRRFHDEIEFAEYLQLASVGLLESVDRFDASHGVQFKTFSARRMHGAILNGLEKITEKQQQIAFRKQLQAERRESLKGLDDSGSTGKKGQEDLFRNLANVGIGLALAYLLEGTGMIDAQEERSESHGYYQHIELQQLQQRIRMLIDDLSEQERTVVRSHYLQEMQFSEIATMLGLSKGRIAQVHRQALERLRSAIQGRGKLDVFL